MSMLSLENNISQLKIPKAMVIPIGNKFNEQMLVN